MDDPTESVNRREGALVGLNFELSFNTLSSLLSRLPIGAWNELQREQLR